MFHEIFQEAHAILYGDFSYDLHKSPQHAVKNMLENIEIKDFARRRLRTVYKLAQNPFMFPISKMNPVARQKLLELCELSNHVYDCYDFVMCASLKDRYGTATKRFNDVQKLLEQSTSYRKEGKECVSILKQVMPLVQASSDTDRRKLKVLENLLRQNIRFYPFHYLTETAKASILELCRF